MKGASTFGYLAFLLAACQTAGYLQNGIPAEDFPQRAGKDIFAVALGDARALLSEGLVNKADAYFHGGVEHSCTVGSAEAHEEHDEQKESAAVAKPSPVSSPFQWMNAYLHSQEHRHTSDDKAGELLPWLWAACRADPHNDNAYETSAYVLDRMTHRPEKALELIQEGVRNNPASASLRFYLGEIYLLRMHDPVHAEAAFSAARDVCRDTEEGRLLRLRSLDYLGYLANKRGDRDALLRFLSEARSLSPRHECTLSLERLISGQNH